MSADPVMETAGGAVTGAGEDADAGVGEDAAEVDATAFAVSAVVWARLLRHKAIATRKSEVFLSIAICFD